MKVLLLNNQHLGMVVQWEDRFIKATGPTRTWARSTTPKPRGQGDGLGSEESLSRLCEDRQGLRLRRRHVRNKADLMPALEEMINYDGPYVLDVEVPYSRARAADDPRRAHRAGYD